ncbi:MAG TPA: hypothetical protein VKS78_02925 [Roseiarcus sp.]|nr:hypothetical protein [Roseiarcus sp.]
MYFVAGFLVAGLAAMLILPAFWRRALRLSARRVRLQAPLSVSEAVAERDQLRADRAVAERRLEHRVEALQAASADHRAGLGRQAKRIVELEDRAADLSREIEELTGDLKAARREATDLQSELGAGRIALSDISAQLERAKSRVAAQGDQRVALDIRVDEQRAAIAALETRAAGLEARLADQAQAAKLKAEAQAAARAREIQQARDELAQIEARVAANDRSREEALIESGRRLGDVAARDAALAEKDRIIRDLNERLSKKTEGAPEPVLPAEKRQDDRLLREAIAKLGADVARLTGESEAQSLLLPTIGPRRRRESSSASEEGEAATSARRARTPSPAP